MTPTKNRFQTWLHRFAIWLIACAWLSFGVGCSGPAQTGPKYPLWQGPDQEAFSDDIDPAAVGLTLEDRPSPRADGLLRQRAQTADVVSRFKVQTVTVDTVGDRAIYHLRVVMIGKPIRAEEDEQQVFELSIRPESPAYSVARSLDTRLQGMMFVGLLKRFQDEWKEQSLHFFLAVDDEEVLAAISEAISLAEVSGN